MRRSFRNRRAGLGYFLYEGLRSVLVHTFMSFASVTIIAACLLITGTFGLVAYNIDLMVRNLGDMSTIMIFVDETLTEREAKNLLTHLTAVPNVDKALFVSRDALLESFLKSIGEDAHLLEGIEVDNPLRHAYQISMKDIEQHKETVAALMKIDGVASSNSDLEVSDRLVQIRRVVNLISFTLIAMLGAVSVFIISNTVKLALFSRREEIAIMRMVGATNHFIRAPFVVEGVTLGLLAAGLAYLCQWGVYGYITRALGEGTRIFAMVPFVDFSKPLIFILLAVGAFIGVVGSSLSIRKFLKV